MLNTFRYVALSLIRDKGIMIWSLAFPIILSTCFIFMFAGLDSEDVIDPVPVIVVEDENYEDAFAFDSFIKEVSGEGGMALDGSAGGTAFGGYISADADESEDAESEPLLKVTYAPSAAEAQALLWESEGTDDPSVGYVIVNADGAPELFARNISSATGLEEIDREILLVALDTYKSKSGLFMTMVENDPQALADPAVMTSLFSTADITERVSVTHNPPKESVRYYFALLGMAALFGAQSGLIAVMRLMPNLGPLGARRELGGISHTAALAGTIAASWVISTACLLIAFLYIRFAAGVDFAGRDGECVLAIAASSLMATSLGAFLGSIPKLSVGSKMGLLTIAVCLASFFAGLYGQPTMELADSIAKSYPITQYVNPAVQISQVFYSIMYYDGAGAMLSHVGILLAFTALFFILSVNFLRKQRYASL